MVHCDMRFFARKDSRNDSSYRHWDPESEAFPPATVLLQFIQEGWGLDSIVAIETFYFSGSGTADVYHFKLHLGHNTIEIPVLANPAVLRLVESCEMQKTKVNISRERNAILVPVRS